MGNYTLYGILLGIGLFFLFSGLLLAQIDVANPYTGQESSLFSIIIGYIIP